MLWLLPQITLKSQYTSDCLKYLNLRKLKTNRIAVIMRQLYEMEKFSTSIEKAGKRTLLGKLILSFQVFFSEKSLTDNLNTLVLPSLWQRQSVCWCLILGGSWGSGDRLQRPRHGRALREGVKTSGARRGDCGMWERRHCLALLPLKLLPPLSPLFSVFSAPRFGSRTAGPSGGRSTQPRWPRPRRSRTRKPSG